MKLYGGIDLHSNNSVIALLDDEDKVACRRRLANDIELVLTELAPFSDSIVGLVVESTYTKRTKRHRTLIQYVANIGFVEKPLDELSLFLQ
jgi:hypothetical protein